MFPELLFRIPLWWISHIWWFISSKYAWLLLTWARCTFSLGSNLMEQSFHQHVSQLGSNSVKIFQKGSLFPQALVSVYTFKKKKNLHPPSFIMKHVWKTFYLQKQGFRLHSNLSNGFWKVSLDPKKNIAKRFLLHNSWDLTGGNLENGKLTELSILSQMVLLQKVQICWETNSKKL